MSFDGCERRSAAACTGLECRRHGEQCRAARARHRPMSTTLNVRVWRGGADGRLQSFDVPREPNQTVLDVVTYIQRALDPTLAYRYACRVGMCGSCAMTVNGAPRWTCRTHVDRVAKDGAL